MDSPSLWGLESIVSHCSLDFPCTIMKSSSCSMTALGIPISIQMWVYQATCNNPYGQGIIGMDGSQGWGLWWWGITSYRWNFLFLVILLLLLCWGQYVIKWLEFTHIITWVKKERKKTWRNFWDTSSRGYSEEVLLSSILFVLFCRHTFCHVEMFVMGGLLRIIQE